MLPTSPARFLWTALAVLALIGPSLGRGAEPAGTSCRTVLFGDGKVQSATLNPGTLKIEGSGLASRSLQDEISLSTVAREANLLVDFQFTGISCGTVPVKVTLFKTEGPTCWHQTFTTSLNLPSEGNASRLTLQMRGGSSFQIQSTDPQGKVLSQQMFPVSLNEFDKLSVAFEPSVGGALQLQRIELEEPGFRSLFNGRDLSEWESSGGSLEGIWSVKEGTIACSGQKRVWLRSKQQYGDFHLKFEYLLNKGGNSGLYVRVPADGNHHRENASLPPAGLEIQLLDDADAQYRALKDYQYSASLYDIVGAKPRVSRPAGEWNTFEVEVTGQHYRVWHNGAQVIDADANCYPLLNLRQVSGFLGLQNHASVIQFRNLRIGSVLNGH